MNDCGCATTEWNCDDDDIGDAINAQSRADEEESQEEGSLSWLWLLALLGVGYWFSQQKR